MSFSSRAPLDMEVAQLTQMDAVAFGEQRCQLLAQDGQNCLNIRLANSGRMAGDVIGELGEVDAAGLADLRKKFLWLSGLGWIAKLDGLIFYTHNASL